MNNSLEKRVAHLEKKVAQLEKQLQSRDQPIQQLDADTEQALYGATIQKEHEHAPVQQQSPATDKRKKREVAKSEPIEWEVLIFQKILPRVFIIILILGVLWGLKAAYDYGFITIPVILTLSILLSIAMIIIGLFQMKKERRILGQVLIGGAIPIFMLTIFAMHQIYDMIGSTPAFLFNLIAIAIGITFTTYFRSQSIGIISAVAGLLVPYLIESTSPNYYLFVSYEGLLYLLFLTLSLYLNFKLLYITSTIFLHVAILGLYMFTSVADGYQLIVILPVIIQQFALFFGLIFTKVSIKTQAYTLLTSLLITSVWVIVQLDQVTQVAVFIGLAALYTIGYYVFQKDILRASIFIVNGSLAVLFTFLAFESELVYEILLAMIIVYIYYANKFNTPLHYALALLFYLIAFSSFETLYLEAFLSYEMLHKLTFLMTTAFLLYFFINASAEKNYNNLIVNVGIPYFAILLLMFSGDVTDLMTDSLILYDYNPLVLSGFWVTISIGFMVFSKISSFTVGKFTGVAILFLTVAKVILFDISFMDISIRAILFIALGIIGLIVSRIYYKNNK